MAAELKVAKTLGRVTVHALTTGMFSRRPVAAQLQDALSTLDIELIWDAPVISGDVVVVHNPSCLRFDTKLPGKIIARHLIAVEHENFLQPTGQEAYDVRACHDLLLHGSLALRRSLAPISDWNRRSIDGWSNTFGQLDGWDKLGLDWFNICDLPLTPPTDVPGDRRGRHSRPGFDKFPPPETMAHCFPEHADHNLILGADALIAADEAPQHWTLVPFRGMAVEDYLRQIDFMVYYTAPTFRESFGRVLAEGIAAGKLVISDAETASTFGGAVIAADPREVNQVIARYVADPASYQRAVRTAQAVLAAFSPEAFQDQIGPYLTGQAALDDAA